MCATGFVALDFETANEKRASACSIGLVKVSPSGKIIDSFSTLLKPHPDYAYFSPINIWIHGIQPEDVEDAPSWDQVYSHIRTFIGDLPIVAHNMAFDGYVLSDLTSLYNQEDILNRRFCTVRIARRILSELPSRRLPELYSHYFPGEEFEHHEALADAIACAQIFSNMQAKYSFEQLEQLCPPTGPGAIGQKTKHRKFLSTEEGLAQLKAVLASVSLRNDARTLLNQHSIAFTGVTQLAKRDAYFALVEELGGVAEKNVTKRTTILVFGIPNPAVWTDAAGSKKLLKATKLRESGSPIEVMSETDFIHFLEAEGI